VATETTRKLKKFVPLALIKSISGIRGTIGGKPGDTLSPIDVVKFTSAFGAILKNKNPNKKIKVVIGRDGRISGPMVSGLVSNTLIAIGIDVVDLGLSTTPTVEIAVPLEKADGGIILTASHNPKEWNALKLLNEKGEFISAETGQELLEIATAENFAYAPVDKLGNITVDDSYMQKHIDAILQYPLVNKKAIAKKNFKVVVDAINSTGATFVPALLNALGVEEVIVLNAEVTGNFAHNPEPLPNHLRELSSAVVKENTLVAVADYILSQKKGNTVSNMSSTKALKEITLKHGGEYFPSAVGEVNVVNKMKENNAVIGGEGNGGIIVPDFHYGRDALIGIALFLSHLANQKNGIKSLRNQYPDYFISKNKIELDKGIDVAAIFEKIKKKYKKNPVNTEDGLKIEFDEDWVHLRTSNTEPIIRIYSESDFETKANNIAQRLMQDIKEAMA